MKSNIIIICVLYHLSYAVLNNFLAIATLYTDTFTLLTITKSHDDVRAITKRSEDIFRIATTYNYILTEFTQHQVNIFGLITICTSLNNVELLSSDVSLAVYNKLNVSVGFIRKSRTNFIDVRVSSFLLNFCLDLPSKKCRCSVVF